MGGFWGYWTAERASRFLGPESAGALALRVGRGAGFFPSKARQWVCRNLSGLFGGEPESYLPQARRVFGHFACYLAEFFTMDRTGWLSVSIEGEGHLKQAYQAGCGVIVLASHLGNWELGGVLLRRMDYPVSAVALPHADDRLNRLFDRQRTRCGVEVIAMRDGAAFRESLRCLRQGRLLGLLGDRDYAGDGFVLPIGRGHFKVPRGPALLSARSGAPLLAAVLIRKAPRDFVLRFHAPIWPKQAVSEGDVKLLAEQSTAVLASEIVKYAEQWIMFDDVIDS